MIKLTLIVYVPGQFERTVYDYLMGHAFRHKLFHFCDATVGREKAEKGTLEASDCLAQTVWVDLGIEKQDGYEPRNKVVDYHKTSPKDVKQADPEDDLPF